SLPPGAVLIAAAGLLTACSDLTQPTDPLRAGGASLADAASAPAQGPMAANYEIRFMEGMIDHHMMAVMTGELCIEKAVHEELRSLCEQIVGTQIQEIQTMQSWLSDWYGVSYEPQMKPGMTKE